MTDFRSARMDSPEGKGIARRAWDAYAKAINKAAAPYAEPFARKLRISASLSTGRSARASAMCSEYLLDDLAPARARQVGEFGVEALQVPLDRAVSGGVHGVFLSTK